MDRRRALALWPLAALFLIAAGSTYKLTETESRSRARRAWLAEHAALTRDMGYSAEYALDDAAVYAASQFADLTDAEFAAVLGLYQKYDGPERARLARFTCSAILDWSRSPHLTPAHRAAAECALCELVTEYAGDPSLIGPLFGAAAELQLADNAYLRHVAHQYVDSRDSNPQVAEFISQSFLSNPHARHGAPPRPTKVASTR